MDTSKYNFKKIKESNEDGLFHQEFIDEDKHVKYIRVTWDSSEIPKEALNEALKIIFNMLEVAKKVAPNIAKVNLKDNYYEMLTFEDDDIGFNSNRLLPGIIKRLMEPKVSCIHNMSEYMKVMNEVINKLPEDPEYVDAIKEIYKDYLDKEL